LYIFSSTEIILSSREDPTWKESLFFQKDETSSIAKRRPPTGAPKAAGKWLANFYFQFFRGNIPWQGSLYGT